MWAYYKENFVRQLVIRHGYASDSLIPNSAVLEIEKTGNNADDSKLFVKMNDKNKFWLLLLARIVGIDKAYELFDQMLDEIVILHLGSLDIRQIKLGSFKFFIGFSPCDALIKLHHGFFIWKPGDLCIHVFYYSVSAYEWCLEVTTFASVVLNVCSFVMAYYKENFVLVVNGNTGDGDNLFGKMCQLDIVSFKSKDVCNQNLASDKASYLYFNLTGGVFDRGRYIELMERDSCFDGDNKFYVDTIIFYEPGLEDTYQFALLLANLIEILLPTEGENCDTCKLLAQKIHQAKVLCTILLLSIPNESDCGNVQKLPHEMHHTGNWTSDGDTQFLILLLKYGLLEAIAVLYLGSWNIFQLKLLSFRYVLYGFLDLQL
ncbi:uncharacterized protein LOC113331770 [Papaver somniferum]|uniref:uncharacterized protein LOC113331770 n=1 Tax=Papaver somniferum TaxID=3469 RepID=UPI000E6F837D|nr:uncharacterized protein LOC113331770 [Papaver somniferum]